MAKMNRKLAIFLFLITGTLSYPFLVLFAISLGKGEIKINGFK
jgi:hypothetical protein